MNLNFFGLILRIVISALILLPLLKPFIEKSVDREPPKIVTVWVDIALPWAESDEAASELQLRKKLELDESVKLNFRRFGALIQTPVQDYEELITQLSATDGRQIVISNGALWGPAARNYLRQIKNLTSSSTRSVLLMTPNDLGIRSRRRTPDRFLALSELSAPQLNFLGEASQLSLDITGRLNAGERLPVEVIVRSGEALLTSKTITVTADASGLVNTIENIPVHFTRAQQQLLTAQLSTDLSPVPLNIASTPVSVVHSKTTVLHVGVGPDWSLRSMRTKLKFWPNLDLLSYYIMREITDDFSIPSSQLSLIEFPSEKLFGEQLPNFHGVLAQNFLFDSYLNQRDTQNLYDYVNTNGGRLVMQAGPLTLQGRDSKISELFPCENLPRFEMDKPHRWKVGKNRFLSEAQFESAVSQIVTSQTAIGCKPKAGALVLAETSDDPPSPVVLAYPVGKGLVVAILAGDWHTAGTQSPADTPTQKAHRVYAIDAGEHLFQWMVEFLQRRQDSGLRPPQFAGPRFYREDPIHLVRSRGGMPENSTLLGSGQGFDSTAGKPAYLTNLALEAVVWERLTSRTNLSEAKSFFNSAAQIPADAARPPRFEQVGLSWQTSAAESLPRLQQGQRPLVWPVFDGTSRERENYTNPALFPAELTTITPEFSKSLSLKQEAKDIRLLPLLKAYPWLLALILFLLAFEQLLSRLTGSQPARIAAAGNKNPPKT
jgi:hypothetical protein